MNEPSPVVKRFTQVRIEVEALGGVAPYCVLHGVDADDLERACDAIATDLLMRAIEKDGVLDLPAIMRHTYLAGRVDGLRAAAESMEDFRT